MPLPSTLRIFAPALSVVLSGLLAFHSFGATAETSQPANPPQLTIPSEPAIQKLLISEEAATVSGNAPAVIESSRRLIAATLARLAELRADSGDHADAASLLKNAYAAQPSNQLALQLASEMLASGDAADAKAIADVVLQSEPRSKPAFELSTGKQPLNPPLRAARLSPSRSLALEATLRRVLATAYDAWGTAVIHQNSDYQRAVQFFQAAAHWDPTTPGAMRDLGMAAFRLGQFQNSAAAFQSVLLSSPANDEAHLLLGLSLFSLKNFPGAAQAFAPARAAVLSNTQAAYAWAFSLAHINDPLQANQILDAIVDRSMPAENLMLVCQVYDQTENYEHAITCLRKLAKQDASIPKLHYQIGVSLIHLSRPAEAVPELREEIRTNPGDLDAQTFLAYALTATGQKAEAQKLLEAVVQQQPEDGDAQYQLGKLLATEQQWPEAITHLEAAANVEPKNFDIHYQLQNAYRRNGRQAEAAKELAIYKQLKDASRSSQSAH